MTKVSKNLKKRSWLLKKVVTLTFLLISSLLVNAQQQIVVKGKVFSEKNNEAIIGATIKVKKSAKGELNGTISDGKGNFSLNVK